jgi:hypothetical protein
VTQKNRTKKETEVLASPVESQSPTDDRTHIHVHLESPQVGQVRLYVNVAGGIRQILDGQGGEIPPGIENSLDPSLWEVIIRGRNGLYTFIKTGFLLLKHSLTLETTFFLSSICIYLITRLVGLDRFPIFFFTDEAVQTVLAQDLVSAGWRGGDQVFLPTYFLNSYQYNLGVSVYAQVLPFILFGKSILITRCVSVLVSCLAVIYVGLILKNIFHSPYYWVAVLTLSITPAWFLHSRTAFETVMATAFYAGFLYYYLRYRTGFPNNLYPAVIMGALSFYSYSPALLVVVLSASLFFLTDLPYHWKHRFIVLKGFGLTILMTLPLLRFQWEHPQENYNHLRVLNSYWIQPISWAEKVQRYIHEYTKGLRISYWFFPHNEDMTRHTMKNYGHLLRYSLPFAIFGLGLVVWKIRSAPYRVLLISLLVAPAGAALVALGITRALIMVIPASILIALGISFLIEKAQTKWNFRKWVLSLIVFMVMGGFNLYILSDALVYGPTWYTDYGLGGMQWGAPYVFDRIDNYIKYHPGAKMILSPSWANGTDTIARLFYPGELPFQMGSIEGYFDSKLPLDDETIFVMIPEEYNKLIQSPKFKEIKIEEIIPYPNGEPGFYFIKLKYADNIDAILTSEGEKRKILQEQQLTVDGDTANVKYSYLDMGSINNVFDGNDNTMIRTMEANPLRLDIAFSRSHPMKGAELRVGGTATGIDLALLDEHGQVLVVRHVEAGDDPNPRKLQVDFGSIYTPSQVVIEVKSLNDTEPAHVHLWEVKFNK